MSRLMTRTVRRSVILGVLAAVAATARVAQAQEPAKPDTARPVPTLPTIETTAPREERVTFEQKPNVGTISITGSALTSAPRFFGEADILRAVRLLPGVNARNDYSVGMNVRGGEADQNLVLLDGYPIYNPFHMGGIFGAFVEPMVDRVDFMTGGFPARYGGRLSSVLDVRSKEETRAGVHGRADISLIATTVAVGGGMQGGQSSWNVAARRTYADKIADVFYKKNSLPYHFRDAQLHVTRVLPRDWRLSFTAYDNVDDLFESSVDDFDSGSGEDASYSISWGNRLVGATLARAFVGRLGDSTRLEQRVSTTRFNVGMNLFEGALALNNHVRDDRLSGVLTAFTARHSASVGYDVGAQRFGFNANYPLLLYPSDTVNNRNTTIGAYAEDLWRVNDRWIVQAGARVDAVAGGGGTVFQPRISVKHFLTRDLAVTGAVGSYAQAVHSLAREDVPIRALDYWVGSSRSAPMSRAWHYVAGVERWLSRSRALRVEGFYKRYGSLLEQNPYSDPDISGDEFLPVRGASYGGDLMLRQFASSGFAGWLSYSVALSTRIDAFGRSFRPGHDRRHDVNFVGNWIGRRYTLSARMNLATGTPYTRIITDYDRTDYDPFERNFDSRAGYTQFIVDERNAERLPISHRIDLSLTRNGDGRGVSVSPFLSIMNVYNAKNVFAYLFDYSERPAERIGLQQFPIFPTIGVSIAW
jgi:hypothetical protein